MKNRQTTIFLLVFLSTTILFNGCTKDDTTKPTISLSGGNADINLGDDIVPPTVTANDDKDGNISSNIIITGLPTNSDQAGEFIVKYDVMDAAGNSADQSTWTLRIGTDPLKGTYSCSSKDSLQTDPPYTLNFNIEVKQDTIQYNQITIKNLQKWADQTFIGTVIGNTITLDEVTTKSGDDNVIINGTGKIKKTGVKKYAISKLTYTEKIGNQDPTIYTTTIMTKVAK